MKKEYAFALVLVLTMPCITATLPAKADFKMIVVPDDYPMISAAIGNAADGDVVLVKRGVYEEKPLEINKSLSILGEDLNSTIIKVNAPIIDVTRIVSQIYTTIADAIIINAKSVKLSNLTVVTGGNIVAKGDRIQILGNNITLRSSVVGVSISGSHCNITDNTSDGLISLSGSSSRVSGNSFSKISVVGNSNTVSNNTCWNLELANASENVVSGNKIGITKGDFCGILVRGSSVNNFFYANHIAGGSIDGVALNSDSAENNTFYHNNFVDNGIYVTAKKHNFWDDSEEGNYWEDYNSTDADRDGIGDTPYVIDSDNVDHYPLMEPYDVERGAVVLPPPEPPEQFPTTIIVAAAATAVAIGAGALIYFKKRRREAAILPQTTSR